MLREKILEVWKEDEIFEEMDRMKIEAEMENRAEIKIGISAGLFLGTSTWIFGAKGLVLAAGGIFATYKWYMRRMRMLKIAVVKMEKARRTIKKRQQIQFSLSFGIAAQNPLITKSCQLSIEFIKKLWENLEDSESSLKNFYPSDLLKIIESEEAEIPENLELLETLISVSRLHLSEICASWIIKSDLNYWKMLKLSYSAENIGSKFEKLETSASFSPNSRRKRGNLESYTWKNEIFMALDEILAKLESSEKAEIEVALKRCLELLGRVGILEKPRENEKLELKIEPDPEIEQYRPVENMDVDMMFEAQSMSEAEKSKLRNLRLNESRDHFLDGCEARKHEKSLLGELQMVLEPRRADFVQREKAALAKFYGISEAEVEMTLEVAENPEKAVEYLKDDYDWKKDAENTAGIHQESDNLDFLQMLANRCVQDEIIE